MIERRAPSNLLSGRRMQPPHTFTTNHVTVRLWALIFTIGVVTLTFITFPTAQHWAIIPILGCAIATATLPFRFEAFHPSFILAPLFAHFFVLAPILELLTQRGMPPSLRAPNLDPWLGAMAILNLAGLLLFRAGWVYADRRAKLRTHWQLNERRFILLLIPMLIVSGALQLALYLRFGGISGYVAAYDETVENFSGLGMYFTFSESFPILLFIGYAVLAQRRPRAKTLSAVLLALCAFLVLKILFGGLRGSRSNTIWGLLWAAGIVHLYLHRLPKWTFAAGVSLTLLFTYFYGFYKESGSEATISALKGDHQQVAEETGRDIAYVLLSDLARSGVQAFLLHRLIDSPAPYSYALGTSYIGAAALIVPRSIWPSRPPTKVRFGTEAMHGPHVYASGYTSAAQYGLAGEAMLNFTPLAVPIAFLLYGLALGTMSAKTRQLSRSDCRWLLVPILSVLFCLALTSDSDNLAVFFLKNCLLPLLLIRLSSKSSRQAPATTTA